MAESGDKIYVVDADDALHALERRPYDSEDLLQTLLERYPDLLAGDQMGGDEPRRWALVSREVGVPGEEGGGDRWSLDHLFLDQDGVPTLVEVKRSSDTRIRREVVGQMLDYAANAVVYWPVDRLAAAFEATAEADGADPAERLAELTGEPDGWGDYWQRVKTNLQAGRVRMTFVADVIPPELRRVVEFLNGQMDPAEVVAVEVRQYVGGSLRTLVPRVVGQTVQAERKKEGARREARQWDEASFLTTLEAERGADERAAAEAVLSWAAERGLRVWWGRGRTYGSFFPMLDVGDESHWTFAVFTHGVVELQLQHMKPPFATDARKRELLDRLKEIPGVAFQHERPTGRPNFPLAALTRPDRRREFLDVIDWTMVETRSVAGTG